MVEALGRCGEEIEHDCGKLPVTVKKPVYMELQVALLLGGDGGLLLAVASLAIRRAGKEMLRREGIGRDSTRLKICPAREAATINVQHQKGRRDTGSGVVCDLTS